MAPEVIVKGLKKVLYIQYTGWDQWWYTVEWL